MDPLAFDIDVIERDRGLPGLRTALDPDALREAMGPHFAAEPTSIRPLYVRYKPGVNCLVLYELTFNGVTLPAYGKYFGRDFEVKLGKAAGQPAVDTPVGRGRIALHEHAAVISIFPNDLKLGSLRHLLNPQGRARLLRKALRQSEELWEADISTLRYKPERRFVAALHVDGAPVAAVKLLTPSSYYHARLASRVVARWPRPVTPLFLGRSRRHGLLGYSWIPGRNLADIILSEPFDADPVAAAGYELGRLHEQSPGRLPVVEHASDADELRAIVEAVSVLLPSLAPRAQSCVQRAVERLQTSKDIGKLVHGDFYAKQIIISKAKVAFLDFDRARSGNPSADLGNFLAHLHRDQIRGSISIEEAERYKEALLYGYADSGGRCRPQDVTLATAVALVRLLPHPFRFREPQWPDQTHRLLETAESLIRSHDAVVRFATPADRGPRWNDPDKVGPEVPAFSSDQTRNVTTLEERLSDFLSTTAGDSSGGRVKACRVVRRKPGRRSLIECELEGGNSILAKVRPKGADARSYKIQRALWMDGFGPSAPDGIHVPEPIGLIQEMNCWLQKKVDGTPAWRHLAGPDGASVAGRIASAIHKLHVTGPPTDRLHGVDDELRILDERIGSLIMERDDLKTRLERVLAGCRELASEIPRAMIRPVHRDFYPDNVLVDGPRVFLVDLDLYCMGDPALDAGNFVGHLVEWVLRTPGKQEAMSTAAKAFIDTFAGLNGAGSRRAVDIYATLTLARHIQLSTLFEERKPFTELILQICEQRLDCDERLPRAANLNGVA